MACALSDFRYLPVMVEASRRRYPGVNVEVGDARSLDGHPSDHFGLVSFKDAPFVCHGCGKQTTLVTTGNLPADRRSEGD